MAAKAPRDRWVSDFDDLTGKETDRALAMVGITGDQMGERVMSMACAVAVVTRQRDEPDLPDETWETLKLRDIDLRSTADPADEADPTSSASEGG